MSKASRLTVAFVVALAALVPAWAEDEEKTPGAMFFTDDGGPVENDMNVAEKVTNSIGEVAKAATDIIIPPARAVVDGGTGSATPREGKDERASFEERWLREREGYRDGGY